MTAEIAILNKSSVALAADSKVTVTINGSRKTYDTVNKLFSLSKTEPVGAMIFGSAEFMEFPWETIIKEYRRKKPTKRFSTIQKWSEDSLLFLTGFFEFNSDDEANFAFMAAAKELDRLSQLIDRRSRAMPEESTDEAILSLEKDIVETAIAQLDKLDNCFTEEAWKNFCSNNSEVFDEVVSNFTEDPNNEIYDLLVQFARLVVSKKSTRNVVSGLVIAGFGEEELFPSVIAHNVEGIISGELKSAIINGADISRENTAAILPFAQGDMVHRFMDGIDPSYKMFYDHTFKELLLNHTMSVLQHMDIAEEEIEASKADISSALVKSMDGLQKATANFQREAFSDSVVEMASRLPRDELAHMAESLVNLTSLQRKVSPNIETVGGAVDVAVISKGDGFVWIKRKHYFPPDKNLQFVKSYLSEYNTENNIGVDHD